MSLESKRWRIESRRSASPLNEKENREAFAMWYRSYKFAKTDQEILPYLNNNFETFKLGEVGWLEKVRKALYLSTYAVATRLNVSRTTYSAYENREKNGTITLVKLAQIAESMDCELVYAIRPKSKKTFSQIIWDKMSDSILKDTWLRNCDPKQRGRAAAAIANKFATRAEFKKEIGWSQRLNS